jgi:lipoyl(octanoyl) transferase
VVIGEGKVAGAAQRRTRGGMLHQGSIQGVPGIDEARGSFVEALAKTAVPVAIPREVLARAVFLEQSKYGTREWMARW